MASTKSTLQVIGNHLRAAAENMAYTLYRTALSTFVKETQDFTTHDHRRLRARPSRCPMDLGRHLVSRHQLWPRHGDDQGYEPGDICFTNDPYCGYRRHPCAGHAHVETGIPRGRDRRLRLRPYPQHRHGRQPCPRACRAR